MSRGNRAERRRLQRQWGRRVKVVLATPTDLATMVCNSCHQLVRDCICRRADGSLVPW